MSAPLLYSYRFVPDSSPLIMTINRNYVLATACALYSIGKASPRTKRCIILGSDLSGSDTALLAQVAGAAGLDMQIINSAAKLAALGDLPVSIYSRDAWARLLIPELCEGVKRCVYVDADMLCLGSMDELLATNLDGCIIGAVPDMFQPTFKMPKIIRKSAAGKTAPYFNAGMLVIDCEAWRKADVTGRALKLAKDHPQLLRFPDQDALNIVLYGKWKQLDPKWNVPPVGDLVKTGMFSLAGEALNEAVKLEQRARILHYITTQKPWRPDYPEGEHLNRYRQVMRAVKDRPSPL